MRRILLTLALAGGLLAGFLLAGPAAASGCTFHADGAMTCLGQTYSNAKRLSICDALRPNSANWINLRCDWRP